MFTHLGVTAGNKALFGQMEGMGGLDDERGLRELFGEFNPTPKSQTEPLPPAAEAFSEQDTYYLIMAWIMVMTPIVYSALDSDQEKSA